VIDGGDGGGVLLGGEKEPLQDPLIAKPATISSV
jgi:hypothetical protein